MSFEHGNVAHPEGHQFQAPDQGWGRHQIVPEPDPRMGWAVGPDQFPGPPGNPFIEGPGPDQPNPWPGGPGTPVTGPTQMVSAPSL